MLDGRSPADEMGFTTAFIGAERRVRHDGQHEMNVGQYQSTINIIEPVASVRFRRHGRIGASSALPRQRKAMFLPTAASRLSMKTSRTHHAHCIVASSISIHMAFYGGRLPTLQACHASRRMARQTMAPSAKLIFTCHLHRGAITFDAGDRRGQDIGER